MLNTNEILSMNQLHLDIIANQRLGPMVTSRNLAIMHEAMDHAYDEARKAGCQDSERGVAVNASAYYMLKAAYPEELPRLDRYFDTQDFDAFDQCVFPGIRSGLVTYYVRTVDGSALNVTYTPKKTRGHWQETGTGPAQRPGWGRVRPFAFKEPKSYVLKAPPTLNSTDYLSDFNETMSLGAKNSTTRTADQTASALFWESGPGTYTPPGQWSFILQALCRKTNFDYQKTLMVFRQFTSALGDAGIAAWMNKYKYETWRPVTAIRENPAYASWEPLIRTPAFPEYPSGHSTFSGAAGEILKKYFDDGIDFTITYFGMKRTFKSIPEACKDAGRSRIYGGIHFDFSNEIALNLGARIAQETMRRID